MLSWVLLILVIAAVALLGTRLSANIFGRGEVLPPMDEPHEVIDANRQAVAQGRFDDIELEVVRRGYRQDQVDALIEQLIGREEANTPAENESRIGYTQIDPNPIDPNVPVSTTRSSDD